ncbi:urease accessory protein UreE [Erwinia sp. OLTSP20]|uniref:urease accessory protein UreE n=1 Tax=unclassified Erwinia TaxID=2622719 RepID=UPI000C17C0AB|nr:MULTISPECIES: urease accessory protein UreE [unclassified Erwinia]PIJ50127.1 urease accessory protein UreE [Erwinia sp. OAMSP11]PIJ71893.1 urease accessory protein UreE [Erwinia sp. OLSSP12]PIJ81095.1 urease accessory protein UreE [Erwinia sp. OLCASP19]PIJ83525.1 urease accessory protein UreE [Erwinia sp. OLMTSP26]PIJ86140.1 urease accessory protein UreE [Erwinia sp. OLMDSP33]
MKIVERVLGNVNKENFWAQRMHTLTPDRLVLSQWEAQKSRCRKHTLGGLELGILLDRNQPLEDGDVLLWDASQQLMVIVELKLLEVLVIYPGLLQGAVTQLMATCFTLGHALGNQHWKALFKDNRVFIPLTVPRKMVESVLKSHGFSQFPFACVQGEMLLPGLTPAEARVLFAGAEDTSTHVHVTSQPLTIQPTSLP